MFEKLYLNCCFFFVVFFSLGFSVSAGRSDREELLSAGNQHILEMAALATCYDRGMSARHFVTDHIGMHIQA